MGIYSCRRMERPSSCRVSIGQTRGPLVTRHPHSPFLSHGRWHRRKSINAGGRSQLNSGGNNQKMLTLVARRGPPFSPTQGSTAPSLDLRHLGLHLCRASCSTHGAYCKMKNVEPWPGEGKSWARSPHPQWTCNLRSRLVSNLDWGWLGGPLLSPRWERSGPSSLENPRVCT